MKTKTFKKFLMLSILAAVLIVLFNNCSKMNSGPSSAPSLPTLVPASTTLSASQNSCLMGNAASECLVNVRTGVNITSGSIAVFYSNGGTEQLFACYSVSGSYNQNAIIQPNSNYTFSAFTAPDCSVTSSSGLTIVESATVTSQPLVTTATYGIIDPSLAQDSGNSTGAWLTYSTLFSSGNSHVKVNTRLAYSSNNGESWSDVGEINDSLDVTLTGNSIGTWVNETSQLIYDPNALPNEQYKLIWFRYVWINGQPRMENSWISAKVASTPFGLASAPEVKLFAGAHYNAANNTEGNLSTGSPLGGLPVLQLNTLHSDLSSCNAVVEPGMYATSSAIYMSVLCGLPTAVGSFVFLIKCSSPCNMASASNWTYIGKMSSVSVTDYLVPSTGEGTEIGPAPGMFADSTGAVYLTISNKDYTGCDVYRFNSIDTYVTGPGGERQVPMSELFSSVLSVPDQTSGACAYNTAASRAGMMYAIKKINPTPFTVFIGSSGVNF